MRQRRCERNLSWSLVNYSLVQCILLSVVFFSFISLQAVAEEDVWAKYNIQSIPAERIVRYEYDVDTRQFVTEETIVKIEKEPFTHGAMRHCFRMKKLATPPKSASNHRFHSYGWSRSLNYVAK